MHFMNETKYCVLIEISPKFVPKGPIDKKDNNGSCNGLASNGWRITVWTSDEIDYWRIYASLGHSELRASAFEGFVFQQYIERSCLSLGKVSVLSQTRGQTVTVGDYYRRWHDKHTV